MKTNLLSSMKHSNYNQRMHPTIKLIMWMSVFLLFFTTQNVFSQGGLDCDTSDVCSGSWLNKSIRKNLGSGITAIIHYRIRDCNGTSQIIVDSTLALDNGRFLDSVNRYHYKYQALNDLIDVYLLQHEYNNPSTPVFNGSRYVTQLYKASCGVWLKCSYIVDSTTIDCDQGYDEPYPHNTTLDSIHIYKWHPCGYVCCKKTFEIERRLTPVTIPGQQFIVNIKNISIHRANKTPACTEQHRYDEPCEDGC